MQQDIIQMSMSLSNRILTDSSTHPIILYSTAKNYNFILYAVMESIKLIIIIQTLQILE